MSSTPHPEDDVRVDGSYWYARRSYLLVVLTLTLGVIRVDRIALGLGLQDIKTDLQLSDTQLGLMTGLAFTLFFAAVGVPIARWADRGNRVAIISLAAALWGAGVCFCGTAASFLQLLMIRVFVAVGEAGCYPASLSLISDYFNRSDRPRAVARFMLGLPLALAVGNLVVGWSIELHGWRATFVAIGLPGTALAALAALTLKEPRQTRALTAVCDAAPSAQPTLKEVLSTLWGCTAYRHLLLCFSIWGFFGYGILQWQPVFLMRSHGLTSGQLGGLLALFYGVGGLVGSYLGGELAARFAPNNERLQLLAVAGVYALLAALNASVYLASSIDVVLTLLGLSAVGGAASNGPLFAAIQTLVPSRMRATATALMYLFCNLIGMGLGPLTAGVLSDLLQPWLGAESLRYALLALSPGYLWCAWHLRRASRTIEHDMSIQHAG
jgi:MFS family permease